MRARFIPVLLATFFIGCPPPTSTTGPRRTVRRANPEGDKPGRMRPAEPPATYKEYFTVNRGGKALGQAYVGFEKNEDGAMFELRFAQSAGWGVMTRHVKLQTDDKLTPKKMWAVEMEQEAGTTLRLYARYDVVIGASEVRVTTTRFGHNWTTRHAVSDAMPLLRYPLLAAYLLARRHGKSAEGRSFEYAGIDVVTGRTQRVELTSTVGGDRATVHIDFGAAGKLNAGYDTAWAKLSEVSGTKRLHTYKVGGKAPAVVPPPASFSKNVKKVKPFLWPKALQTTAVDVKLKGLTIRGVLSLPAGAAKTKKRYPLVVLVPAANTADRDGTRGMRKPYAEVAALLSAAGYAVYRYAPRGVAPTGGDLAKVRFSRLYKDLRVVVARLRKNKRVKRSRVFLLGHAEGGLVAAYYAAKRKRDLRGVILVSTPGVPYQDYILDQWRRRWLTVGMKVPVVNKRIAWFKAAMKQAIAGQRKTFLGRPGSLLGDLIKLNPLRAFRRAKLRTLILTGGADATCRADDVNALRAGMPKNRKITVSQPANVGHFLQHSPRFLEVTEMWKVPSPISPAASKPLLDWLGKAR